MLQIKDKKFEILLPQTQIEAEIKKLSATLNYGYLDKKPLFLAVLNGSFMFAAELFKHLKIEAEISFMRVQSYSKTNSTGTLKQILGLVNDIENRDIVILEDIVDTGFTINEIVIFLNEKKPKSIKIATLLFKPKALKVPIKPDYFCFEIEPDFVVGYGLDYDELGRNLADVWVLSET